MRINKVLSIFPDFPLPLTSGIKIDKCRTKRVWRCTSSRTCYEHTAVHTSVVYTVWRGRLLSTGWRDSACSLTRARRTVKFCLSFSLVGAQAYIISGHLHIHYGTCNLSGWPDRAPEGVPSFICRHYDYFVDIIFLGKLAAPTIENFGFFGSRAGVFIQLTSS